MAYKNFDDHSTDTGSAGNAAVQNSITLKIDGDTLDLPDASFVRDADIQRDSMDLILHSPDGTVTIEGYFAAEPTPNLTAPDGETLTPALVQSFVHGTAQYADAGSLNDASPVGAVQEVTGSASVTRVDGSIETISKGTPIYQGDVIETSGEGAVNIVFADQTSFAVSEDARLAIDEYVYDPSSQSGTSNFSILKGVFVFTSGLIGREDPDDVKIDTPVGSIGIRGTIIMGDVDTGEITVVEGAIVLHDLQGHEMTLANQFETGKFLLGNGGIEHIGVKTASDMSQKFVAVSTVAPELFSSLNDAKSEYGDDHNDKPGEDDLLLNEGNPADAPDASTGEVIQNPVSVMPDVNPFTGQQDGLFSVKPPAGFRPVLHNGPDPNQDPAPAGVHQTAPLQMGAPLGDNPPPLAVNVQVFGLNENANGGMIVARLIGAFSPNITFTLTGPNAGVLYVLDNITATTADVKYIGAPRDFEVNPGLLPPVGFIATNDSGSATLNGVVNAPLMNLFDEAPVLNPNTNIAPEYFTASEGTTWKIDLNNLFRDKEIVHGDVLSYKLDGATTSFLTGLGAKIASTNVNLSTGDITGNILEINFANFDFVSDVTGGAFNIIATDIGGNTVQHSRTFSVYDATTSSFSVAGSNAVYSTTSTANISINVSGTVNKVFSGHGNDLVDTIGSNHEIHGGFGDDTISIDDTSANSKFFGDHGSDTFEIKSISNKIYGMEGNDTFRLHLSFANADLAGGTTTVIDGGTDFLSLGTATGGDALKIADSGNINFTGVNNAFIKNIETLDIQNGNFNIVTMNFSDIFDMTDSRKTLIINTDSGDDFTFNASSETITSAGTVTNGSDTFNVYHIASGANNVTLLVDQTAAVSGLP